MTTITTQIRDVMYDKILRRMPVGSVFKTARKIPFPTLQPDMVPSLGVYVLREAMSPYGDANAGPPHYTVDSIIGVMVLDLAGKPSVLEGGVDNKIDQIEELLLRDPEMVNVRDIETNSIVLDSIPIISRSYQFPKDGETYYMEARLQFTLRYTVVYEPIIPDDLKVIHVTTFLPGSPPPPSGEPAIPHVISVYELDQEQE